MKRGKSPGGLCDPSFRYFAYGPNPDLIAQAPTFEAGLNGEEPRTAPQCK